MNQALLIGRLTRDPEVKSTQSGKDVCSFTVAVDRNYKDKSGERPTDFISCVAFDQKARLLGQYFRKGSRIGIIGSIQTRDYKDKDDKKVYVTEVVVDAIEFIDSKSDKPESKPSEYQAAMMDDDSPLPFDL
jgi:single-strand DNA-binding protein